MTVSALSSATSTTPSSATGTSAAGLTSVAGLASGIQYNNIIDAMITADGASTAVEQTRMQTFQATQTALRSLNTKMLGVQLDLATLNDPSLYNGHTATPSNTSVLGATADSTAALGTYNFQVLSVAQANQIATVGNTSETANLGAGSISIQLGQAGATTIQIPEGSSNLDGIAQTINAAGLGVNASVINDGSGSASYRLMLTSQNTGTANAITVTGTGGQASLFTGATTLQAASDAQIAIGSGANAITLTNSSNTFTNVVQGVTLTAQSLGSSSVTIGTDASGVSSAVSTLVSDFNGIAQFMTDNASYDSTTNVQGPLFSDSSVRSAFNSLTQQLLGSVPGLPLSMSTLSAIGVGYDQTTGQLTLDQTQLASAIQSNPQGVGKLFTNSATCSSSGIQFGLLNDKTKLNGPFTIQVTQPAARAITSGTSDLAASTVITSANNTLNVTVNGRAYTATIANGTYTPDQLSARVQAALNTAITQPSDMLSTSMVNNRLSLTGVGYGVAATIQVDSGSSANSVLNLATNINYGTDCAGTINGVPATGAGQTLSGATGTDAEGLRLIVTATAPVASATMTINPGIGPQAATLVKGMTDSVTGSLTGEVTSLQTTIDNLNASITETNDRLATRRARYQQQFQAMEQSISQSNTMGTYMTAQIKGFQTAASSG
jgi:flagellar hook-associated protein 2